MLSPDDIRLKCERKYEAFLRSIARNEPFFPLDIRFGRPSSTDAWESLTAEVTALTRGTPDYSIDWEEVNTRRWGRQKLPVRVWFPHERAYLRFLRKQAEVDAFRKDLALIREQCAALTGWAADNPLRVTEYAELWPGLLNVCRFFQGNPRPGLFARELPVAVDTKFIERHQVILRSLLDCLLPASARRETSHFETRFGLRFDEPLIRMRVLDSDEQRRLHLPVEDLSVPLSQFQALRWITSELLIVENKMTFLTLPTRANAVGIFGGGGAAELLTRVHWCKECPLLYWGDLDVHGFHILSRLRRAFPHARSVMMDNATVRQYRELCVPAKPSSYEDVGALTPAELAAYVQLRDECLLLEQERLPPRYVREQLAGHHPR